MMTDQQDLHEGNYDNGHKGDRLYNRGDTSVIDCKHCGFAHVMPLPSEETLAALYEQEFYKEEKPAYLENAQEDLEWIKHTASTKYKRFEEQLPSDRRRLLDIGCGPGFFLDEGVARGWSVLGLEPSVHAADFVRQRGIDVVTSMFNEVFVDEYKQSFDVVHMSSVLEHVRLPHQILAWAVKLLRPGGLICITCPNDFNPLQTALVELQQYDSWWVVPDHHLNYFNFSSLERLIVRHGFQELQRDASFPLELFLLMGDNYISDSKLGRGVHHKRVAMEMSLAGSRHEHLLSKLYQSFAELELGRLATVYGKLKA